LTPAAGISFIADVGDFRYTIDKTKVFDSDPSAIKIKETAIQGLETNL